MFATVVGSVEGRSWPGGAVKEELGRVPASTHTLEPFVCWIMERSRGLCCKMQAPALP